MENGREGKGREGKGREWSGDSTTNKENKM